MDIILEQYGITKDEIEKLNENEIEILKEYFYLINGSINILKEETENPNNTGSDSIDPVYICLVDVDKFRNKIIKLWTHSDYSHACISFTEKLDKMYTFGDEIDKNTGKKRLGFVIDSKNKLLGINPNAKFKCIAFFVTSEQKKLMNQFCLNYNKNKNKTDYNLGNILGIVLNHPISKFLKDPYKMICSQFVYTVLALANFTMKKEKDAALVTPGDLDTLSNDSRMVEIYEGLLKKYNASKIKKYIKEIQDNMLNYTDR